MTLLCKVPWDVYILLLLFIIIILYNWGCRATVYFCIIAADWNVFGHPRGKLFKEGANHSGSPSDDDGKRDDGLPEKELQLAEHMLIFIILTESDILAQTATQLWVMEQ